MRTAASPATTLTDEQPLPLFRIGGSGNGRRPIAVIGGGLILDVGEAERTFIYRCQDRFLAYSSLWGLRSIFFAASDAHVEIYRRHVARQRNLYDRIRARTGLLAARPLNEPLYVGCNIDRLRLFACAGFAAQWREEGTPTAILLNQLSPTYAALLGQLAALLRRHGMAAELALDEAAALGSLARQCADKADYLVAVGAGSGLPAHVPTALIASAELEALAGYDALVSIYRDRAKGAPAAPDRLFVKATLNSGGNLAAAVDRSNFTAGMQKLRDVLVAEAAQGGQGLERKTAELRQEIVDAPCLRAVPLAEEQLRLCKLEQAGRRRHVDFLVQAEVRRRDDDDAFAGIGLSYVIGADGSVTPLGATGQVYRDPDHKHFLGSFLSDQVSRDMPPSFHREMSALCRLYHARGYRGPISFDARRDDDGRYRLIYDCNPRLTGVFPSLAVRDALALSGVPVRSVLSLGYRGEFVMPELDMALERLDEAGLLCTLGRGRGAVLLPNLSRQDGFDLHFVNVGMHEIDRLFTATVERLSAVAAVPHRLHY